MCAIAAVLYRDLGLFNFIRLIFLLGLLIIKIIFGILDLDLSYILCNDGNSMQSGYPNNPSNNPAGNNYMPPSNGAGSYSHRYDTSKLYDFLQQYKGKKVSASGINLGSRGYNQDPYLAEMSRIYAHVRAYDSHIFPNITSVRTASAMTVTSDYLDKLYDLKKDYAQGWPPRSASAQFHRPSRS